MVNFEIRGFANGQWTDAKTPEWFDRATQTEDDWTMAFAAYKVICVDELDYGDIIGIYRTDHGTYCVVFWDPAQVILVVFIEAASDYIEFRARFIAPNVPLMLAGKQMDQGTQRAAA
jgi:hypothetical protein